VLHVPLAIVERDQARLDMVQARQLGQLLEFEQRLEIRDSLTDQERFLVPVIAQELGGVIFPRSCKFLHAPL
jgi:hypothetical protein